MKIYIPLTEEEMMTMYRCDISALNQYHTYVMCKPVEVPEEVYHREDFEVWLKEQINEPSVQN